MAPIFFVKRGERNLPRQRHAHVSADPSLGRRFAVDGKDLATVIVSCGGAGVPTLPPRHSSDPIWGKPRQVTGPKGVPTLGDFAAARNPAPTVQR